jgi:uncharacterized protein
MRITVDDQLNFYHLIREFLDQDQILEMKKYIQHGNTTTFAHCMAVAYYSYCLALRLPKKYDIKSTVRGAVLHDFYLYDWHIPSKSHKLHGYVHPGFALKNAREYFKLNTIEEDIISKHMWPLTLSKVPRYPEAMLVCLVDKFISLAETLYIPVVPKKLIPHRTKYQQS